MPGRFRPAGGRYLSQTKKRRGAIRRPPGTITDLRVIFHQTYTLPEETGDEMAWSRERLSPICFSCSLKIMSFTRCGSGTFRKMKLSASPAVWTRTLPKRKNVARRPCTSTETSWIFSIRHSEVVRLKRFLCSMSMTRFEVMIQTSK